ncbi:hypothetical protein [Cellulomonas iranensis]|uniref:Cap15 family cyclic dinucleotide receptor domain-containing protein n=1 Tax=Cellulomonas iranensis TaxID=76862 RepID=UPI003D7D3809
MAALATLLAIAMAWVFETWLSSVPSWIVSGPTVAGAFGACYWLMEAHAWRWPIVRKLGLVDTPDIEGVYIGKLVSSYNSTDLPIRVCIDQTWTRIAVRFEVVEPESSVSHSITAGLSLAGHTHARLTYTYRNQTRPGVAEGDMKDHDGTAELLFDLSRDSARGRYYNLRGRQGSLTLTRELGDVSTGHAGAS